MTKEEKKAYLIRLNKKGLEYRKRWKKRNATAGNISAPIELRPKPCEL